MIFLIVLFIISLISLMPVLLDSTRKYYFAEQFNSLIFICLTGVASVGFARALLNIRPDHFTRILYLALCLIITGALAEVLGVLRPLSDAVRALLYDPQFIYQNDTRDIHGYGFIRPKLFTSEPSHLGKYCAIILCALIILEQDIRKVWGIIALAILAFSIVRSPVILISLILALVRIFQIFGLTTILRHRGMVLMFLVAVGVITGIFALQFNQRMAQGIDPSFYIRVIRPLLVTQEVLTQHPLLGMGIGARDALREIYTAQSMQVLAPIYVRQSLADMNIVFGNVHCAVFIHFGLLGGMAWFGTLMLFSRAIIGHSPLVFWVFYAGYGIFLGGENTPLLWGALGVILAATGQADRFKRRGALA
ncbi:hypothetical protein [Amylibacter marinus]|nr:hypothetical protein [Amylibacter marinus]